MKRLITQRYTVRHNIVAIICVCLSAYFSWHAVLGERSSVRLVTLDYKVEKLERDVSALKAQRLAIEDKVSRLRPDSIDPDMLEERARLVLGFNYGTERVLLNQ